MPKELKTKAELREMILGELTTSGFPGALGIAIRGVADAADPSNWAADISGVGSKDDAPVRIELRDFITGLQHKYDLAC